MLCNLVATCTRAYMFYARNLLLRPPDNCGQCSWQFSGRSLVCVCRLTYAAMVCRVLLWLQRYCPKKDAGRDGQANIPRCVLVASPSLSYHPSVSLRRTSLFTHTHTHTHTRARTHIHTRTHTHARTHTNTQTRTQTRTHHFSAIRSCVSLSLDLSCSHSPS